MKPATDKSGKKAAVLGHPVGHSLSPKLHGYWLEKYGINGEYGAIDTPPHRLEATLNELADQGFAGVNLTVPLKEQALPLLDEVDPLAQMIGAANTVVFHEGRKTGHNTDACGFIESLRSALLSDYQLPITNYLGHAVILGAGGAARAVIAGLLREGAMEIILLNRSLERAEKLAEDFREQPITNYQLPITIYPWQSRHDALEGATLLVNTTSLGMRGQPPLEISLEALPRQALVTDIVYAPLETPLLAEARRRRNPAVDGLGMLLYQAQPAFSLFFGIEPVVDAALRERIGRLAAAR